MCKQLELVQQDALVCPQATSFLLQVKLLTLIEKVQVTCNPIIPIGLG